jgi:APA family basic amino acid/polyamine antiporter
VAEKASLNLYDAALMVAGSMIGSGIFIVSADIARLTGSAGWLLFLWALAGLMTILGALSIAELASMYPRAGGQYIYLKEAYGPMTGFLYGWTLFLVVQSGTIAAVAMAFAKFSGVLFPSISEQTVLLSLGPVDLTTTRLTAIASIGLLTILNASGIQYGKWILRLFTFSKLFALLSLVFLGLFVFGNQEIWNMNMSNMWEAVSFQKSSDSGWTAAPVSGLALLSVLGIGLVGSLFSSDAWNNVTFISGEVKDPAKNIPRSLLMGTGLVIVLYLLVNLAYLRLLPVIGNPEGADVINRGIQFASEDRVGTAAATVMFGSAASLIMAILIMVSTFGCNNGIVLSSVRVYQAMARDGLFFKSLQHDNSKGVPGNALKLQFVWASLLCLSGKYGDLLDYVMFTVMIFYILAIGAVIVLRMRDPKAERSYRVPLYPLLPLLYILLASAFCVNLLLSKPQNTWPGLIIVLAGLPVYYFWKRNTSEAHAA